MTPLLATALVAARSAPTTYLIVKPRRRHTDHVHFVGADGGGGDGASAPSLEASGAAVLSALAVAGVVFGGLATGERS